jgi:hypothetical protein
VEFVVHNICKNITLKATFIVVFFASFFAHAEIDYSKLTPKSPKVEQLDGVQGVTNIGFNYLIDGPLSGLDVNDLCTTMYPESDKVKNVSGEWRLIEQYNEFDSLYGAYCKYDRWDNWGGPHYVSTSEPIVFKASTSTRTFKFCPPDGAPDFTHPKMNADGEPDFCYSVKEMQELLEHEAYLDEINGNCDNLVMDSGNNSSDSMCYTSPNGSSCNVEKVTTNYGGSDFTYYKGTTAEELGCSNSDKPDFDRDGIGSGTDDCFTDASKNYCSASKEDKCLSPNGVEVCADGCLETTDGFFCDTDIHPPETSDGSDYFDTNGTCTVVAGSAYRGACEDLGGTWEKEADYTNTSCPAASIAGSCTVTTGGGCFACLDAGGTWTPDPNAVLSNAEKGIQDVASLTQETNDKLTVLELTQRKGNEALLAATDAGNQKVLDKLIQITGKGEGGLGGISSRLDGIKTAIENQGGSGGSTPTTPDETPDEKYTTTTGTTDKSLMNSLFSPAKVAEVKAASEVIKTDIKSFVNTSKGELYALLTITAPSSSGYTSRSVELKGASFDLSLNRMSSFFSLLAGPVMLLCSIISLFIILGKD